MPAHRKAARAAAAPPAEPARRPTRVLIIAGRPLFSQGLERLLNRPGQVEIRSHVGDRPGALEAARSCQPDVVILCADHDGGNADVLTLLLGLDHPPKILEVSQRTNTITVYRREQRQVSRMEDLIELVREGGADEERKPKAEAA